MNGWRLVDLSTAATVLLDVAAWLVIHPAVVVAMVSVSDRRFDPRGWLFRPRACERGGAIYEDLLRIRSWKHRLPDGADFLRWRSFRKRRLAERSRSNLERFERETCRAELTHLLTMAWAPLFFLWNPLWVGWLMVAYALAQNVPLIVAQRYNRCRLARMLGRARGRTTAAEPGP